MTQKSMFPLTARWFIKHTLIAGRYMGSEESEDEIFPPVQTEQRRSSPSALVLCVPLPLHLS